MAKVYRFQKADYDIDQLAWEIEDRVGLSVIAYDARAEVVGHIYSVRDQLSVAIFERDGEGELPDAQRYRGRILTPDEEAQLAETVARHTPRPRIYRGNLASVVTRYAHSVGRVLVWERATGRERYASCFLWESTDKALTAAHVVNPLQVEVRGIQFGGTRIEARIAKIELRRDLALLALDEQIDGSPLRVRHALRAPDDLGSVAVVIGYPDVPGMEPSPSYYEVAPVSVKRNYLMDEVLLELSTHLGSGCSGAPVIAADHSLLGMILGYPSDDGASQEPVSILWPKWTAFAATCDTIRDWDAGDAA